MRLKAPRRALLSTASVMVLLLGACSTKSAEPSATPATEDTPAAPATPTPGVIIPDGNPDRTPEHPGQPLATADLVELAAPSVVRVSLPGGVGSGVIVDPAGYIVTNNHVVESAPQRVIVTLHDGSDHDAMVVGRDPRADLAVLKIDTGGDLQALPLADHREVRVGDDVVAIGFALDLAAGEGPPSVTRGIVSATNRQIPTSSILGAVQTDAAINHGNSGGPLINYRGEVVGVNTSLAPDTATGGLAQNIGFAVGSGTIEAVYKEIVERGFVDRALLGIGGTGAGQGFSSLRPAEAEDLGLPPDTRGVMIHPLGVNAGGPADLAGIQGNDVIVQIGDHVIEDETDLAIAMVEYDPADTVTIEAYRQGERVTFDVTLGENSTQ